MENIYIGVLGSLLILDTTVLFQFSVSQPLIICTLLGFYFGDVSLGLQIGIYLQILWLSFMPVGAAVVPEGNMAAISSTVMILRYHGDLQYINTVIILGTLYGLLISYIGAEMVVLYRKNNIRILHHTVRKLKNGRTEALPQAIFSSISVHFLLMFVLITGSLYFGDTLFHHIKKIPPGFERYAEFAVISLLGIGSGLLLNLFRDKMARIMILLGIISGMLIYFVK